MLSARNILNGKIQLADVDYVDLDEYKKISKRCNPQKNDVLISCSGSVGRICIVEDENKYVMVRSVAMLRPVDCIPHFIMYTLQSGFLQTQIKNSSKQTAQANLFQGAIKNLLMPLPPLNEQNRIVIRLTQFLPILSNYEKLQTRSIQLDNMIYPMLKSSLLQYAILGKLVPQDPDDEPASVLLERIRAEKEQLIKEGKLKRDKNESYIYRGSDNSYYRKFLCEKIRYKTSILNFHFYNIVDAIFVQKTNKSSSQ